MTTMHNATTVTDQQIRAIAREAGQHGDVLMVRVCQRALRGRKSARAECARVVAAAQAMREERC